MLCARQQEQDRTFCADCLRGSCRLILGTLMHLCLLPAFRFSKPEITD